MLIRHTPTASALSMKSNLIQRSRLELRQATVDMSPGKNVESSGNSSIVNIRPLMVSALAEKTAIVQIWSKWTARSADSDNYFLRKSVFLFFLGQQ